MELAQHIKDQRNRLGMSQEQLAEAIFVSRQTVSNWENDRTYPDVQSLLLLSDLFEVSIDTLIKGDVDEMKQVITAEAKRLNKLSMVMLVCGSITVLWVIVTALMDLSLPVIVIPAVAVFIPAAISAGLVEKIKRNNQLFTYQSIEAFMRGENPDILHQRNQQAGKLWWGKLVGKMVIAAVIGFCCGWGLFSILQKLFG